MAKYLTEFLGTFFFVLIFMLVFAQSMAGALLPIAPLAAGLALAAVVYMGAHVSGGHYNPAISLAAMMRGALSVADLIPYWIAQILGAVVAALACWIITGSSVAPSPGEGYGALEIGPWLVEILFTFALALVALNAGSSSGTVGNSFYGMAIGFTFAAAAYAGGAISGGLFNPALGIGPNLVDGLNVNNLMLHTIAPLIGGALAPLAFRLQESFVDSRL